MSETLRGEARRRAGRGWRRNEREGGLKEGGEGGGRKKRIQRNRGKRDIRRQRGERTEKSENRAKDRNRLDRTETKTGLERRGRGATKAEINRSRSIKERLVRPRRARIRDNKSNGNLLAREWRKFSDRRGDSK